MGDLKLALRPEGLWPHTITQEYGPAAVAVVKAFQAAQGLPPNGAVCELAWGAWARPWEAAVAPPGLHLRPGEPGSSSWTPPSSP